MSAVAKNQFLAAVAGAITRGQITDAAAFQTSAQKAADDVAAAHPGTTAAELLADLPKAWATQPDSYEAKQQATAFMQVAGPVLGVNVATSGAVTTRMLNALGEANDQIAVNRFKAVMSSPSPALAADVPPGPSAKALQTVLLAAFGDKSMTDVVGGKRYQHLANADLARACVRDDDGTADSDFGDDVRCRATARR